MSATARALRLDYYRIKERLRAGGTEAPPGVAPGFVEIAPRAPVPSPEGPPPECVVEFDDGRWGEDAGAACGGGADDALLARTSLLSSLARLFLGRPA